MLTLPEPTADTPTLAKLKAALASIEPSTRPQWGTMDASAMLEHCARFIDLYSGRVAVATPLRLLARVLGPTFLRKVVAKSPTATPRNLRTLGPLKVSGTDDYDETQWKTRFQALMDGLDEIESLEAPYRNALYGAMDPDAARTLVRHHTAHHFHQFGLL